MKYLTFAFLILLPFVARCQKHTLLGLQVAKDELKTALNNKKDRQVIVDKIIGDKQTAIAVAEAILFRIYGKEQIINERPYEVYFIDGYWVLNGTLPEKMLGGGFLIIFSAKDGRVVRLTHYK
ncbi:NTF2 fold immunity protein [Mucilaginibacter celer]|uniref:NTF2 fold domain-containing protein n=1 Tax=Mucilaginibacter celer TaxID=2305508 RepID=A0A494VNW8_9SPHI|nr:NTF2 fold immunity protein [Mucilaginibacter celer]AYL94770.1 hypothetical protein HYN43_005415 [Mucilaginibacter celer]